MYYTNGFNFPLQDTLQCVVWPRRLTPWVHMYVDRKNAIACMHSSMVPSPDITQHMHNSTSLFYIGCMHTPSVTSPLLDSGNCEMHMVFNVNE